MKGPRFESHLGQLFFMSEKLLIFPTVKPKSAKICEFFNTAPFFYWTKKVKLHVDHQNHQLGWPIRGLEGLANLIEMMSELLGGLKTVEAERSKLGTVSIKNRVRSRHPFWIWETPRCLKITQNVTFEFFLILAFSTNFVNSTF